MKCPVCKDVNLVMSDRQGVEIDYCPECRGVWLDRGELDKIIERSVAAPAPSHAPQPERHYEGYDKKDREYQQKHKKSKAGSFLGDIFDF